jgi:hypothetical protein
VYGKKQNIHILMTISRVLLIHYDSIVAGSSIPRDQLF